MINSRAKRICRAGIFAALYAALTFPVIGFASGAIQFRPSEALTLLPLIYPEAVPALFAGCAVANLISGCTAVDIICGSAITFAAALMTFLTGKLLRNGKLAVFVGGLFPILLNAFLLPVVWKFAYGQTEYVYILSAAFLLVSQSVTVWLLGIPLAMAVIRLRKKGVSALS